MACNDKTITGQQSPQAALEQAASRFQLLNQAIEDAVFDWDLIAHDVWRNQNYQRQFGVPEKSPDSDNCWADGLHPEDRERVIKVQKDALCNGNTLFLAGYRLRRQDGSYADIHERSLIVRDARGQVVRMLGTLTDITERKRADEALREYEKIAEAVQPLIAVVDREYRYLLINKAFLKHRGLTQEQVVGRSVAELLGNDVFERVIKTRLDACFQGEFVQYEMKYKYPDVGERDLLVSYIPIRGPFGVDRVASFIQDITELRQAEKAVTASEERYRDLVENASDIVFTSDLRGNITSVNMAAEKHSGYTRAELTCMNVFQVLAPQYVEEGHHVLEALMAGREPGVGQWEVVAKDGRRIWLEVSLRPIRVNGEVVGAQGIARDITDRRGTEEALRQSEARFHAVFENAGIGIAVVDMQGHPVESNPALQKMLGYNKTELAQMALTDYTYPDDAQTSWKLFTELCNGKCNRYQLEKRYCRKDGQIMWGQLTGSLVRDQNGEPQYAIGMIEDITERKQAEEALGESEARFSNLFESVPVGIYRTTPDGRILIANPALLRMLGFSSLQELASRNLQLEGFAASHPRSEFREQVEREGEVSSFESLWKRRDGTAVAIRESARAVRASDGRVLYYDGIVDDITERRRVEEALKESEARFRAVFENAGIGIALVDMQGHPVESNPALQKMLGYTKAELAQMAFTEYTHPEDAQADWESYVELIEGACDQYQLEKRFCRKDGQIVWAHLTVSLIRNKNGQPQYAIGMVEDVTARKQANEALRQLSGRLLRLQDEERRHIARELHDSTSQHLAALGMNLTGVMRWTPNLSPRARTCLSESAKLAEECSHEIRTLSYLLHPPLLDEVGLDSAVRWFIDGYAQRTGIPVSLEMPSELGRLPQDIELALYRMVQEGLTNIHLHSGSKKARVCLERLPGEVLLTVADEGHGLPPGLLEHKGLPKLGVGISGMRERIGQLGGQFELDSGSKGTVLRARVPLRRDEV